MVASDHGSTKVKSAVPKSEALCQTPLPETATSGWESKGTYASVIQYQLNRVGCPVVSVSALGRAKFERRAALIGRHSG